MISQVVFRSKLKFIFSRKFIPALLSISAGLALSAITRSRRLMVFALDQRKRAEQVEVELLTHYSEKFSRKLKIAVVRFDGLGDTALTLPLLDALQADERVGEVIAIVPDKVSFALSGFYSGQLFPIRPFSIHYPRLGKNIASNLVTYSFVGAFLSWYQGLMVRKSLGVFDLVVLPRWDHDLDLNTRFFARGLGRFVVGHNPKWIDNSHREFLDISLLDFICDSPKKSAHEFDHLTNLADLLGLVVSKHKLGSVATVVECNSTIFVQMSAALSKRVWSFDNWVKVLQSLSASHPKWNFIVNSSSKDEFRKLQAALSPKSRSAFTELVLGDTNALYDAMSNSALYLGSDTGPLHLAEYLNIRSIVISCHPKNGSAEHVNSPARFGNSKDLGFWIGPDVGLDGCSEGCEQKRAHCINEVKWELVLQTIDGALDEPLN